MPKTSEYQQLIAAHQELKLQYLPTNQLLVATPAEQELARSFIVFMHAEIEYYFETVCKKMLLAMRTQFNQGVFTKSHVGLMTFGTWPSTTGGEYLVNSSKSAAVRKVSDRFNKAISDLDKAVDENHGIRQKYLSAMFVPLGLTDRQIDPDWITAIDTVAEKRGSFAHRSRKTTDGRPDGINPQDFDKAVSRVIFSQHQGVPQPYINSIEEFDDWVSDVCNGIVPSGMRPSPYRAFKHRVGWSLLRLLERV